MNWHSLLTAVLSMAVIGIFHSLVLAAYRRLGWKGWPLFLFLGLAMLFSALMTEGLLSIALALCGAACLWSVWELRKLRKKEQKG